MLSALLFCASVKPSSVASRLTRICARVAGVGAVVVPVDVWAHERAAAASTVRIVFEIIVGCEPPFTVLNGSSRLRVAAPRVKDCQAVLSDCADLPPRPLAHARGSDLRSTAVTFWSGIEMRRVICVHPRPSAAICVWEGRLKRN